MNNLNDLNFVDLLKMKKKNLSDQADLRKQSEALDKEIASRQEVLNAVGDLHESGGSKRVKLNGLIPLDLRVQYRVTRSWDQDYIDTIKSEVPPNLFPFKTQYVEDAKATAALSETRPEIYKMVQKGLQTKINERPYISFVDLPKNENTSK